MDENPRRDLIVSTILRFGLATLLCSLPILKFGLNAVGAGYGFLIFVPCAFMLSKPIIGWVEAYGSFVTRQPYVKWQGNYYEFAGKQIRVHAVGNSLWFVDIDVLKVIDQKLSLIQESSFDAHEYDVIPGTRQRGFSEEGVEKLLLANDHYESKRMLMWIQREVVKPFRRRLEMCKAQ